MQVRVGNEEAFKRKQQGTKKTKSKGAVNEGSVKKRERASSEITSTVRRAVQQCQALKKSWKDLSPALREEIRDLTIELLKGSGNAAARTEAKGFSPQRWTEVIKNVVQKEMKKKTPDGVQHLDFVSAQAESDAPDP